MAPDMSTIMRFILTETTDVSTYDIKAYVTEHQDVHSRLIKADPTGTAELLITQHIWIVFWTGLSTEQKLSMNYFPSLWEDLSKTLAKDVFKVGLKLASQFELANDLGTGDSRRRYPNR